MRFIMAQNERDKKVIMFSHMQPLADETFVDIYVQKPITHHTHHDGRYTTYEIVIETNNIAFSHQKSATRRRYSEFVWLRSVLSKHHREKTPPPLPPKKWFGQQFDSEVIVERMQGLQNFLRRLVREMLYLSDSTLHLFLQTNLSCKRMDDCLAGVSGKDILQVILDSQTELDVSPQNSSSGISSIVDVTESTSPLQTSPNIIFSPTRASSFPADFLDNSYLGTPNMTSTPYAKDRVIQAHAGHEDSSTECSGDSDVGGTGSSSSSVSDSSNTAEGCREKLRKKTRKRTVTFSPEVTVAEVIGRFEAEVAQTGIVVVKDRKNRQRQSTE